MSKSRLPILGILVLGSALYGTIAEAETRDEFRAKVRNGMNQDQVVAAVGKPDHTKDRYGVTYYYYLKRTRDPGSKNVDYEAKVKFFDGRVQWIEFNQQRTD